MAVTIKKKELTLVHIVERLFGTEIKPVGLLSKANALQENGYYLITTPTTFSITKDGKIVSSVTLKINAVSLAMKHKGGVSVLILIRQRIIELISQAFIVYEVVEAKKIKAQQTAYMDKNDPDVKNQVMAVALHKGKSAGIKHLRTLTGLSLKESKDLIEVWAAASGLPPVTNPKIGVDWGTESWGTEDTKITGTSTGHHNVGGNPVPLKEATTLRQPVEGTSGGSIYHVIALGKTVKVAARIRANNDVAIRAEIIPHHATKDAQKARQGLLAAGLAKTKGTHFSLHLDPEDFNMAKRSIGSTLFATGLEFYAISCDLKQIQGEGK